jgi:phosphatidylglycerol:prolipoprotein diacylglycerol transferase
VLAFVPVIAVYLALKPESFGSTILTQLSTSQWIGMITAVLAGFFYAQLWSESYKSPLLAMSLGDGVEEQNESAAAEARAEEADDDETAGDAEPAPQK